MNRKKLLFLCGGGFLPHPNGNGNAVLTYGILSVLSKLNFAIEIVPIALRCPLEKYNKDKEFLIKEFGIKVVEFDRVLYPKGNSLLSIKTWLRLIFPNKDLNYFYSTHDSKELVQYIDTARFSIVYGYDWDCISIFDHIKSDDVKKVISLVDLIDVFFASRRKKIAKKISFKSIIPIVNYLLARRKPHLAMKYLKGVDLIVEHAFQHAAQLIEKGFKNVHYIPHPIKGKVIASSDNNDKLIISMIGSLKGTSSQLGFYYFLDELYPKMKARKSEWTGTVEFRVVGYGKLPDDIYQRLKQIEELNFVGFVEDVEEQYHVADIILVNIPVSQGFRTRIAEAFSYKKCVVAHIANAEGMPEAVPGHNILMSNDSAELVDMLINVVKSKNLRETIAVNALNTFNEKLSADIAHKKYKVLMDDLLM